MTSDRCSGDAIPCCGINDEDHAPGCTLLAEVQALREVAAHATLMLMVCPCDDDTTKKYKAAVDKFKESMLAYSKIPGLDAYKPPTAETPSGPIGRGEP